MDYEEFKVLILCLLINPVTFGLVFICYGLYLIVRPEKIQRIALRSIPNINLWIFNWQRDALARSSYIIQIRVMAVVSILAGIAMIIAFIYGQI